LDSVTATKLRRSKMTTEEVFNVLADVDIDAELIEVFHESGDIWVRISNVEIEESDDG